MQQYYGRKPYMRRPLFGKSWPYHDYNHNQYYSSQVPNQMYQQPYFQPYPNQQMMYYNNNSNFTYPNPYPKANNQTQQPSGVQAIMSQFKTKDGTYDINKLMDTAGQMMGAYNQVSSIVKGLVKTFKV